MNSYQLSLFENVKRDLDIEGSYRERLVALLSGDLDFHDRDSGYASHHFHSFPAKFPPQLPARFIEHLTQPQDVVLDPMMGSGTTIVEAYLSGRQGIGLDIDPLALLVSRVKVTPVDVDQVREWRRRILRGARLALQDRPDELRNLLDTRLDKKTRQFLDYWYAPKIQLQLLALRVEIERIEDIVLRNFFDLAFSATIITKRGGVSLALDLAHTRPQRAKVVYDQQGQPIVGKDLVDSDNRRVQLLTKKLRSPLSEFNKRISQNLAGILQGGDGLIEPEIRFGDAQEMPLAEATVDLLVTSPPYASNAIDYMRAHKFSLVWMGYQIDELGQKRQEYIGGEATAGMTFAHMPAMSRAVVEELAAVDEKKGRVLQRYYTEMKRVLAEAYRVLKPGKAAVLVVGSSVLRGIDTCTEQCLAEIGEVVGFEVPRIGVRQLDRNRRMMPAGTTVDSGSQIQQRMHQEYVIGFYKPDADEHSNSEDGAQ